MGGSITMSGNRVTELGQPVSARDAATREYVDTHALPAAESTEAPGSYSHTAGGEREWWNPPVLGGSEYRTGERHLGKPVYRKIVSFGSLPNAATKSVAHGIGDLGTAIDLYGNSSYARSLWQAGVTAIWVDRTHVYITTNEDLHEQTVDITVKYVKA